ncbi:unnamed protein product [Leptosia nina]|uniref:SCP domain-containing protein n=1 Tax=Leptosia nina TaxID=320188 RepID=A0AAV1JH63_9NEOP
MSKLFRTKSSDFETEALEVHNEYRREHGVPPLVLNKEICKVSQKWAEELAKKDSMSYSLNSDYGESVYCGWSSDPNVKIRARDCIDRWYNEINEYSFGKEPEVLNCGHFTQIVWKNTQELGIGSAKSKSGKLYIVANYYPPGNYGGQFVKNVLPPGAFQFKSSSSVSSSESPRESNNNLSSSPQKYGKNISDYASELVTKLKSSSISSERFEEDFLKAHNEYRSKHRAPPLVLNKKLSKYAEEWAKTIAKNGRVEHRDQNEYGENIFYAWSSDPNFVLSGKDPVEKWYSEIKNHEFGKEPDNLGSGHFSQVVWEDTMEVGVGFAKTKEGQVYVVANYHPPGNVLGSFAAKRRSLLSDDDILGVPKYPEHLPRAERILPGHTLLKPAFGMLKSSVKFPQRSIGRDVYGNVENIGISYGNDNERVKYSNFRKANDLLVEDVRRSRKIKSAFRNRQTSESTESSGLSPSSDSSDYEKNEGNPYTIHKDKYKQNWLWNHKRRNSFYKFDPRELSSIVGVPSSPSHLPEAEPVLPGHTLLRPALGMLKSAVKFPHRELENGAGVYGNFDNLGLRYDAKNERVLYTGFRRSPSDYIMYLYNLRGIPNEKPVLRNQNEALNVQSSADVTLEDGVTEKNANETPKPKLVKIQKDFDHLLIDENAPEHNELVPKAISNEKLRKWWFYNQVSETNANQRQKLVIDQDGGADDAMAVFMALLNEKYFEGPEVVALTTVHGNVNESQVFINSGRILNVAERRDIPIYRGCVEPFVRGITSDFFFGFDGLGDNEVEHYDALPSQPLHAALALIELSKLHEGNLIVVAIGALTNIGLAIKLDPKFPSRLAQLYIGAGHIHNEEYKEAEFNAEMDPEAYYMIVNSSLPTDLTIVPFSPIRTAFKIDNNWRLNVLGAIPTTIMQYMNKFERLSIPAAPYWSTLDPVVMAVALHGVVVDTWHTALSSIVLCGKDRGVTPHDFSSATPNARVAVTFNKGIYKFFIYSVFSASLRRANTFLL